jgi:hypothetical protein
LFAAMISRGSTCGMCVCLCVCVCVCVIINAGKKAPKSPRKGTLQTRVDK